MLEADGYPWPKGYGPIEAMSPTSSAPPDAGYPWPKGYGPIEALFRGELDGCRRAVSMAERLWPH